MLSIVIPVYNESSNIKQLFDGISQKISADKELVVVYDFDEDDTLPALRRIEKDYPFPIRTEKNELGRGALNAIITGFRRARGDAVLVTMADLSDDLNAANDMYSLIHDEGYDLVCGSRYMRGGSQTGGPILKGLFSRCAGLSLHLLSGIPTHDVTNSFKMYSKSLLDETQFESTGGFEIGMEITVKAFMAGKRITEVPSSWSDREGGESHFKMWEWIPHYLHWYFKCIGYSWFKIR